MFFFLTEVLQGPESQLKWSAFVCTLQEGGSAWNQELAQLHDEKPGYQWGLV